MRSKLSNPKSPQSNVETMVPAFEGGTGFLKFWKFGEPKLKCSNRSNFIGLGLGFGSGGGGGGGGQSVDVSRWRSSCWVFSLDLRPHITKPWHSLGSFFYHINGLER